MKLLLNVFRVGTNSGNSMTNWKNPFISLPLPHRAIELEYRLGGIAWGGETSSYYFKLLIGDWRVKKVKKNKKTSLSFPRWAI